MLYPRSSEEGVNGQEVPEAVIAKFASHSHLAAYLEEVTEDMPEKFTTIEGVKVGWPEYEEGTEHILYHLPHGKAKTTVELPFYTVWKTTESAGRPDRLHARNQTRQGDGGNRRLAAPHLAADQRRSRRRNAGRTRRNRRSFGTKSEGE